jgi:dGTP triphosphohydrolase
MSEFSIALKERRIIEDNKQFARLIEKTQVNVPQNGRHEVIKNRLTHSYEVATSSLTMASSIAEKMGLDVFDVDYRCALHSVSLLHDLGHPPFGHDGAELLDVRMKALGLEEGFSDNNNNLTVIEKNGIEVRDYVVASTIKYPQKLYASQQEKYLPMLKAALKEDSEHFLSYGINLIAQTKTMACQIMDEADRNSYTFTDMTDFLCMGEKIDVVDILRIASQYGLSDSEPLLQEFIGISQSGDKSVIKAGLSRLKEMANESYVITDMGLEMNNPKIEMLREAINKMTMEFYVAPIRKLPFHSENIQKLDDVLGEMLSGGFLPSRHYKSVVDGADCEQTKLRAIRDMIGEVSDWYVLNVHDELSLGHKKERRPFELIIADAKKVVEKQKEILVSPYNDIEFSPN